MKKVLIVLFALIMSLGSVSGFAEEAQTTEAAIYVKTVDTTRATEVFKRTFENANFSRYGYGENSYIGTPFSVEYQYSRYYGESFGYGEDKWFLYYFPLITDGKITTYIELTVPESDDDEVPFAISSFFNTENGNLNALNDGNVYSIIQDADAGDFLAISEDNNIASVFHWEINESYNYKIPYDGMETTVVNILDPMDDSPSIIGGTEEETALWEKARAESRPVVRLSLDECGYINQNDRVLLPMRAIAESIKCTVSWDSSTQTATAEKDGATVKFTIGKDTYTVNGDTKSLDSPALLEGGTTYIPIRALTEAFGAEIAYNGTAKTITIAY